MKFPRNARIMRSPFEMAPFAAVFFLLLIFLLLAVLLPAPGLPIQPPAANFPGVAAPSVAVAVDAGGRFYFANQIVSEAQLHSKLSDTAKNARAPLTLVIHADKSVSYDQLVRLTVLACGAGISNVLLATLPVAPARPSDHE
jgi:biopolymer transport protein ExbD